MIMKKIIPYIFLLAACGKAEVVTFSDRSTVKKADRAGWTVSASSEETQCEAAPASALLDGNITTYWSSDHCGANPPYPHWVSIDMKNPLHAVTVEVTARQNNTAGMTKFKLEGSTDGSSWAVLGDNLNFTGATKTAQSYPVSSAKAIRYLRLTALAGPLSYAFLAEIEVFAAK
jgi:hypothetical protein